MTLNWVGLNTAPCGTPLVKEWVSENCLPTLTFAVFSERNDLINFNIFSFISSKFT